MMERKMKHRSKFRWWILVVSVVYGLLIIPLFQLMYTYRTQLQSLGSSTPYFIAVAYITLPFYLIIRYAKQKNKK